MPHSTRIIAITPVARLIGSGPGTGGRRHRGGSDPAAQLAEEGGPLAVLRAHAARLDEFDLHYRSARLRRSRFAFNQHGGFRFIGAAGSDRAPS